MLPRAFSRLRFSAVRFGGGTRSEGKRQIGAKLTHFTCEASAAIGLILLFGLVYRRSLQCSNPANPIVAENCLTGNPDSEWDIGEGNAGERTIQGFATDISLNQGGTINFKISTWNARPFLYQLR